MRSVIVGGGVIGLCSAYSLARKGFEVVVVDRGEGPRTSTVNAGMIVPSHIIPLASPGMIGTGLKMMLRPRSPFWIRPRLDRDLLNWGLKFARSCNKSNVDKSIKLLLEMNLASKNAYLDFEKCLERFHVEQKGLLMIARREASLVEESEVAAQVRELGLPARVIEGAEIAKIDPGIDIDAIGGVHYEADCHFSAPAFMSSIESKLIEMGVRFVYGDVQSFDNANGAIRSIQTTAGKLEADWLVLAAGIWTSKLGRSLNLDLPMQAGKGYSFNVEAPPHAPTICAILMEGRVAVTPQPGGVRFGGTMEIGPADDHIDGRRVDGIRHAIPNYYPAFRKVDLKSQTVGVGLRPCTPDGLPYIGKPKTYGNLCVATGHAMMGMSLGPITGKLVSEIVAGEEPSISIGALDPDRFSAA